MLNECSENAFFKHFPMLQYIFIVVLSPTIFCAIHVPEYQSHFKRLVKMHGQKKTFSIHPAVPLQIYLSLFSLSTHFTLEHISTGMQWEFMGMHEAPVHTSTGMHSRAQEQHAHNTCSCVVKRAGKGASGSSVSERSCTLWCWDNLVI